MSKCYKSVGRRGSAPDPTGGAGEEGARCPLPKNPTSALGHTGLKLRPYVPQASALWASPYRPPHFKPWIRPWGPQVTVEPGPLRDLLRTGINVLIYVT